MPRGDRDHTVNKVPTKSPDMESTNKWKIPHYYRRSHVHSPTQYSNPNGSLNSFNGSPNINIMTSPKKLLIEEPQRVKTKSRKSKRKDGQVVFVNYTVLDTEKKATMNTDIEKDIPLAEQHQILKRKSSKNSVLQIFKSSSKNLRNSSNRASLKLVKDKNLHNNNTPAVNLSEVGTLINKSGGPSTASAKVKDTTKSLSAKRSYGSFLKHTKLVPNCNQVAKSYITETLDNQWEGDLEVVPKSLPNPSLAKPSNNNNRDKLTPLKVANIPLFTARHKATSKSKMPSKVEQMKSENNQVVNNHFFDDNTYTTEAVVHASYNTFPTDTDGYKLREENDASVAFSKLFTRKRANTSGAPSSFLNSTCNPNTNQGHNTITRGNTCNNQKQHTANRRINRSSSSSAIAQRTMSIASLSSLSNRYSPNRIISPGRPRSSTRSSSSYRMSRDLGSLYGTASNIPELALENEGNQFLDNQYIANYSQVTNNDNNLNNSMFNHKKNQESISDIHQIYSAGTVASTPSSSFVTPPYFGQALQSSTSAVSTPSCVESTNYHSGTLRPNNNPYGNNDSSSNLPRTRSNHTNSNSVSTRKADQESDNFFSEFSSITTPTGSIYPTWEMQRIEAAIPKQNPKYYENLPKNGYMHRTTSQGYNSNSNNIDRKTNGIERFDGLHSQSKTYHDARKSTSSAVDSLMTNSIGSTASSITPRMNSQDGEKYFLVNTGIASKEINLNHFNKPITENNETSVQATNNNRNDTNNLDNNMDPLSQLYTEFDFENPNSFFHEQSCIMNSTTSNADTLMQNGENTKNDETISSLGLGTSSIISPNSTVQRPFNNLTTTTTNNDSSLPMNGNLGYNSQYNSTEGLDMVNLNDNNAIFDIQSMLLLSELGDNYMTGTKVSNSNDHINDDKIGLPFDNNNS
ncbi:Bck2p NDAI_0B02230 [Naumovozyma dairenensis CBS 421]|uniref:Uncharacterized protein n=1 Tax=Naumovozyma dairenensis (strain ATCC 10597 / BCRC 20456 / CBS 421 / NBRC 0211 / NRRL Y-12639) TaxID=1071378 RepID=G0W647_NAUDC|nr:hypothetical protein NDAI_0B02230 [Naumovozyma dairenensis CBS 421]CCD23258.1 hypothetical protein NDAI_0B02230 [Naumovozyma dairenensis CBS 421]